MSVFTIFSKLWKSYDLSLVQYEEDGRPIFSFTQERETEALNESGNNICIRFFPSLNWYYSSPKSFVRSNKPESLVPRRVNSKTDLELLCHPILYTVGNSSMAFLNQIRFKALCRKIMKMTFDYLMIDLCHLLFQAVEWEPQHKENSLAKYFTGSCYSPKDRCITIYTNMILRLNKITKKLLMPVTTWCRTLKLVLQKYLEVLGNNLTQNFISTGLIDFGDINFGHSPVIGSDL